MRELRSVFRSLIRNGTRSHPRSTRGRNLACLFIAEALALAITVQASVLLAADDIQQIKLGPHIFYLPKEWMQGDRTPRAQGMILAQNPPNPPVKQAQSRPIDATKLDIWPGVAWQPYRAADLPKIIEIIYGTMGRSPRVQQQKRWLDEAATREPDRTGFVRVGVSFANPGVPYFETFLYKGYLNKVGEPLIVHSNNVESPNSGHYLSHVTIRIQQDLGLTYHFSNQEFPESSWWALYERVIAFLEFLQTPK